MSRGVLLIADDYALSPGVSRGIRELIEIGRLSGTGAMTTEPGWAEESLSVMRLRESAAIGLHLNLTTGTPLGMMPMLAPLGRFPGLRALLVRAYAGRLVRAEIDAEIARQLDRFEAFAGVPPDFIDGHHHVQVLPVVRASLMSAIANRYGSAAPLLRNPGDKAYRIAARRGSRLKALFIASLASGFARAAAAHAIPTNDGFSGFSDFDRSIDFSDELAAFRRQPGPRHLIMCHPGYPDSVLRALDPLSDRRLDELEALKRELGLEDWIARPRRDGDGRIAWWQDALRE